MGLFTISMNADSVTYQIKRPGDRRAARSRASLAVHPSQAISSGTVPKDPRIAAALCEPWGVSPACARLCVKADRVDVVGRPRYAENTDQVQAPEMNAAYGRAELRQLRESPAGQLADVIGDAAAQGN